MSDFTLLPAGNRRAQPWKDGGGTTTEVCIHPPGSGLGDFDWRVSIADVDAAGPFSRFTGIDRVLTILEGELDLRLEGETVGRALTARSDPFFFAGDVPSHGAPRTPTVRDLNVMVRRDRWSAQVERLRGEKVCEGALRHEEGPSILVAGTSLVLDVRGHASSLAALDAVLLQRGTAASLIMDPDHDWAIYTRLTRV
jgi:environmental stress-induced protein Ves